MSKLPKTIRQNLIRAGSVLTGWIALGVVFLGKPGLRSVLDQFQAAPQGNLRQAGVLAALGVFTLVLLAASLRWLAAAVLSGRLLPLAPENLTRRQLGFRIWLLAIAGLVLLQFSFSGQVDDPLDRLFFLVIQPMALWGALACSLALLGLVLAAAPAQFSEVLTLRKIGLAFLILGVILLALQVFGFSYSLTDRVNGNFDLPGYPLLGYQVLLACLPGAILLLGAESSWARGAFGLPQKKWPLDLMFCLILFFAALLTWKSIPLQAHIFFDQPRPPNFESYPNSDANLYDRTALNLVTAGRLQTYTYRFPDYVGKRPLLAVYQAGLHSIAGDGYPEIILVQTILFALLPVLVYLLTTSLGSRSSGLVAGILTILRERNGLLLSDTVTGVHSQLLMSEIPTMLLLVLFLTVLIKALRKTDAPGPWFLVAGGILGAAMLVRQEVGILLPFVAVGMVSGFKKRLSQTVGKLALITAGMILVVAPWVARNWAESGRLYLDVPGNRLDLILNTIGVGNDRKPLTDPVLEGFLPGEDFPFSAPAEEDRTGSLGQSALARPSSGSAEAGDPDPGYLRSTLNHFGNQIIQSIVYLPSYPLLIDLDFLSKGLIGKLDRYYGGFFYTPQAYVKSLPYWWSDWSGKIALKSLLPVGGTIFLIAAGLAAARRKDRITAFLPLYAFLGYILIYSLIRRSGGRFLQEMDWVSLVYYSIGAMELLGIVLLKSRPSEELFSSPAAASSRPAPRGIGLRFGLLTAGLVVVGASPWILESLIPNPYTESYLAASVEGNLGMIEQDLKGQDPQALFGELEDGLEAIVGKAYYPRYFLAGEKLVDVRPEVLGKLDQRYELNRIEFYLIGSRTTWVVVPAEGEPQAFPHGGEVLALGCLKDGVFDALAVYLLDELGGVAQVYRRDAPGAQSSTCPLAWP